MKTLIISHNPISTYQSMGKTMLAFFSQFEREELCQLYIYPTLPDTDKCGSYFRITDKAVLKSYLHFRVQSGEVSPLLQSEKTDLSEEDRKLYRNKKNKSPFRILARDWLWRGARWYNKALKAWLDKENPTCIFIAPGAQKFLYDIALKIAKKRGIPIVTYICDEFYFLEKKKGFWGRLQQRALRKKIRKLMQRTAHVIAICDELKEIYSQTFGVAATTLMTGANYPPRETPREVDKPTVLTYTGNIRWNRYTSLATIGKTLDDINAQTNVGYALHIYTSEKDESILSAFDGIQSVQFCGFLQGKAFDDTLKNAEILVHTEAFDDESIDGVKHSVSTKIADCLSVGNCLFAYGPKKVASMRYLLDTQSAVCATEPSALKDALLRVLTDRDSRLKAVENALQAAKANHDGQKTSETLKNILKNL